MDQDTYDTLDSDNKSNFAVGMPIMKVTYGGSVYITNLLKINYGSGTVIEYIAIPISSTTINYVLDLTSGTTTADASSAYIYQSDDPQCKYYENGVYQHDVDCNYKLNGSNFDYAYEMASKTFTLKPYEVIVQDKQDSPSTKISYTVIPNYTNYLLNNNCYVYNGVTNTLNIVCYGEINDGTSLYEYTESKTYTISNWQLMEYKSGDATYGKKYYLGREVVASLEYSNSGKQVKYSLTGRRLFYSVVMNPTVNSYNATKGYFVTKQLSGYYYVPYGTLKDLNSLSYT
jgi:hypothetical protein